ncbi:MAG TPA: hypothetical protein VII99_00860 [Bacteroidia bacterium]
MIASDNSPLGARSSGIGGASVSLADVWAVQNNQAGLGFQKNISGGIVYENSFQIKELSMKAAVLAIPVKRGTIGFCVSDFGYSLYRENKIGLAFGKSFGDKLSAGVMMDYVETKMAEYGKRNSLVAEAGIQTTPLKNLTIGLHIYNLTKTKLTDYNDERIPTIMRLGFNYRFSKKVLVVVETEKNIVKNAIVKAGVEYLPAKALYLRAGISTNPSLSCFGVGINLKQFRVDISTTYHSVLGFSPQVGLIWEIQKPKEIAPEINE